MSEHKKSDAKVLEKGFKSSIQYISRMHQVKIVHKKHPLSNNH